MCALEHLNLDVPAGSITALLGPNGAGKTSTIMAVAGHVEIQGGQIWYQNQDITSWTPMRRVQAGIALVPEGRRLFTGLSVEENLIVGGYVRPKEDTAANRSKVIDLFPRLGERLNQRSGSLSGGEQQMLAIGRALMTQPSLLLVDELSLGLMPKIIDLCYNALKELNRQGLTIVLVEQSTQRALDVSDQVVVLESGRAVWQGTSAEAKENTDLIDSLLGLKERGSA
jgi:branched-chain amino acid transport system ATP-binding protein